MGGFAHIFDKTHSVGRFGPVFNSENEHLPEVCPGLGDFYGDKAEYHFTEAPAYLRANGVLDESNPEDPKVPISG